MAGKRLSTLGLLVGLGLGLLVGFVLGVTAALAAFTPDPAGPGAGTAGTSDGTGSISGGTGSGATWDPLPGLAVPGVGGDSAPAPALNPGELDDCLRRAGIDPAGPRPGGSIGCVGPAPRSAPGPDTAGPAPMTTAAPLTNPAQPPR